MLKSEHELLSKETFTSVARGRGWNEVPYNKLTLPHRKDFVKKL
jgi:hypothetical protein